jgi:uncharacterized Zn finger protein
VTIIDFNEARAARSPVRSSCPDCKGRLTVLRIIPGRAASEYWTMRCVGCGGIHLDILKPMAEPIGA